VFMDDDQVIDAYYLARVGPAFEETQAACMGGTVFHMDADNMPAWLAPLLARSVNGCDQSAESDRMRVLAPGGNEHLVGGNMAFRRQDLLAVGGYDVRLGRRGDFLLAGEDFELQDRLHALGKKIVFHPKLIQYHHLHPERQTRRYWRKLAFFQGRTFYLRDMSARLQRSSRLFHAPRWLWWCLVAKDLPRYAKSRFVLDSSERFSGELQLWRRSGQIYEARLERKATGKNERK
jgi:GT2 family glycosyltransferase